MSVQDIGDETREEVFLSTASRTAKAIRSAAVVPGAPKKSGQLGTDISVSS
jgi:hypothetical protein